MKLCDTVPLRIPVILEVYLHGACIFSVVFPKFSCNAGARPAAVILRLERARERTNGLPFLLLPLGSGIGACRVRHGQQPALSIRNAFSSNVSFYRVSSEGDRYGPKKKKTNKYVVPVKSSGESVS